MTCKIENETYIPTQGKIIHYIFVIQLEENICQTLLQIADSSVLKALFMKKTTYYNSISQSLIRFFITTELNFFNFSTLVKGYNIEFHFKYFITPRNQTQYNMLCTITYRHNVLRIYLKTVETSRLTTNKPSKSQRVLKFQMSYVYPQIVFFCLIYIS